MPDHIHLFAQLNGDISLENWTRYWKSLFTKNHNNPFHKWQTDYWDVQIKDNSIYWDKKEYIFYNPVRSNLALTPDDWSFKGEIFDIEL